MLAVIYDNNTQAPDLIVGPYGFEVDQGLATMVLISLFSWGRQGRDRDGSYRGWWGDSYPPEPGYRLAQSTLYKLIGRKATADVLTEAVNRSKDALAWMVADGIAESVEAEAVAVDFEVIAIAIGIKQPSEPAAVWLGPWQMQLGA